MQVIGQHGQVMSKISLSLHLMSTFPIVFLPILVCQTGAAAFDVIQNSNIQGATQDQSATTLEECYKSCLARSPAECAGFDFSSNKCWIHTTATNTGDVITNSLSNHYNRKECGKSTLMFYFA